MRLVQGLPSQKNAFRDTAVSNNAAAAVWLQQYMKLLPQRGPLRFVHVCRQRGYEAAEEAAAVCAEADSCDVSLL